jgi:hypothetical protein
MPPRTCSSTSSGLITRPQSSTHQCSSSFTIPVSVSTSTQLAWMPLVKAKGKSLVMKCRVCTSSRGRSFGSVSPR